MIHWLIGRSGVGKTAYLLETLPELAEQYREVYVLTPEQGSMALERRIAGAAPGNRVQAVSFRRLCNVIFRKFGGVAGNYMTRSREAALIFRILLEKREELCYYHRARASVGFVTKLRETFSEFARSGLTRDQVLPLLERLPDRKEKFEDLFLLYEAYLAAQNAECRSAESDLAAALTLAAENRFFENAAVVIDGFFGFTGTQRDLLRIIFADSPCVWCAFTMDPAGSAPPFECVENEWRRLIAIAGSVGAETRVVPLTGPSRRLDSDQLRWMEKSFFSASPEKAPPAGNAIRLFCGRNIREEMTLAALTISKAVREEGLRYRDFAMIAGSLEEYGPVAEQVFRKFGVPLFVDQKRASAGKPLFLFVQRAVRIVSRDFRQEDVLAFLKTGLCGETPDRIAALENYCIRWNPVGKKWTGEAPWTKNPAGLAPRTPETDAALAELNEMRERIRKPLLRFAHAVKTGTGKAMAQGIFRLMEDFGVAEKMAAAAERYKELSRHSGVNAQSDLRTAREYASLYAVMTDILDDIYLVFGDSRVDPADLADLIDLCGEENALKVAPPTVDAVLLGTISLSRPGEVRRLFAVGANQDLLPPVVSNPGLIGDRERQIFSENGLPCNATSEENFRQEEARFYSVLFSAREQIAFFYSAFTVAGEPLFPSPYVRRLKQYNVKEETAEDLCLYDFAATREGARELMSRAPAWRGAILAELNERPRPKQAADDPLTAEVVNAFFSRQLRLSFSSINEYQNCPFQYFMSHTLRVKKVEPISFDLPGIGNFVHAGMEKIVLKMIENPEQGWSRDSIGQFSAAFSEDYLREKLGDIEQTPRFLSLYARMTDALNLTARDTAEELVSGAFKPYGAEMAIRVELPLKNGKTVLLTGSADRVDTFTDENGTWIKIIDYKTGGKTFDFSDVTNRVDIQLPLYLYGVRESGAFDRPIPAAACYFNAALPAFTERAAPEDLPAVLRKFYRRSGLICEDPAVLRALDAEHFNINYNKDGTLSKNTRVFSRALLEELTAHMRTIVTETAEEIYGGNTAVLPLKGKKDPCAYCAYRTVCGHTDRDPEREYRKDESGWREGAAE